MRPTTRNEVEAGTSNAGSTDEAELVRRCREGDRAAFAEVVARHQDAVFNTCWRMCGSRQDAEDFAQETFVKALQSIDRFDGRSKLYTWLFRIAVNLVISTRRRRFRMAGRALDAGLDDPPPGDWRGLDSGRNPAAQAPDELAADHERHRIVLEALAALDKDHRAVVVLRDIESLDYSEIAEILNVPAGTVKSRLHRARMSLRQRLMPVLGAT